MGGALVLAAMPPTATLALHHASERRDHVAQPTNGEVVRRYWKAHEAHDYAALGALRHADWSVEWPQTDERIRGHANDNAVARAYPGGLPGMEMAHVVGSEDQWVVGPSFTVNRIVGTGDSWWVDGRLTYPDGSIWFAATLMELRGGKVLHETTYFAPQSEAPPWRKPWVEAIT
jgi:hypothetical protein